MKSMEGRRYFQVTKRAYVHVSVMFVSSLLILTFLLRHFLDSGASNRLLWEASIISPPNSLSLSALSGQQVLPVPSDLNVSDSDVLSNPSNANSITEYNAANTGNETSSDTAGVEAEVKMPRIRKLTSFEDEVGARDETVSQISTLSSDTSVEQKNATLEMPVDTPKVDENGLYTPPDSALPSTAQGSTWDTGFSGSVRECRRTTIRGQCVTQFFDLYDDAYRPLWPGRVDLLIRSYLSDKFFLLEVLLNSIDQMWPKGIGEIILVLDEGDHWAADLVPPWVKIFYEKNYLNLPGKIVQQWSYLWADNYTTAPFISIVDDDVVFNMKVTPALLFNLTEGKPYVIGSQQKQMNHWVPSTRFLVGKQYYFANFMVQLPFTFPRDVLPKFREHVGKLHHKLGSFDQAMKFFSWRGPKFERTQIAHTTLGNYMWSFSRESVHWALEWTKHQPIPRVGVHVPYTQPFRQKTNHSDLAPRVTKTYLELAGYYSHEAVCHAFPKGELPGCDEILRFEQRQIWQYVMDWYDWPLIKFKRPNATFIYDHYKAELHCLYWKTMQSLGSEKSLQKHLATHGKGLLQGLFQECVTKHS